MNRPLTLLLLTFAAATAHADIDLVTLPKKDYVQLTVYNSVDLTLARERRENSGNTARGG